MYGDKLRDEARKLRSGGLKLHDVARELDVSAGWASKATSGVRSEIIVSARLMGSQRARLEDARANAEGRKRRVLQLSKRREATLSSKLANLRQCMAAGEGGRMPHWSSDAYKVIDQAQQLFAKDEQHPLFGLMASEWPEMLGHFVEWKRVRRSPNRSEAGFREMAMRVHDHVMQTGRPPSIADKSSQVQQAAMWMWRWKCNANGRIARKRNVDRAQVFTQIGIIVEMLMSPVPAIYGDGKKQLESGRWTALFNLLMVSSDRGNDKATKRQ